MKNSGPILLGLGIIILLLAIVRHLLVPALIFGSLVHAAVYMAVIGLILIAAGGYMFWGRTA